MQPLPAGWYWDPGGMPGLFRYWDAVQWTEHVSVRWDVAPPYLPVLPEADHDGKFRSGGLALPPLPKPWRRAPNYPNLAQGKGQEIWVGYCHRGEYLGVAYVAELPGDDDFATAGAAWADELLAIYYPFGRPPGHNDSMTAIGGVRAWRRDVEVPVNDPKLEDITTEQVVFLALDNPERGIFYASLPDSERIEFSIDDLVGMLEVS